MNLLSSLNPEQRDAVEQIDGPVLILAGAGSGKTRVIAHRIAHLVEGGFARADEVLAVTFTNKAAGEMRGRVQALVAGDVSSMWISTFHSLCARLLRREAPHIGLSRDFVIYDSTDQLSVVKQAMKELKVDDSFVQPRAALSRISQAKNVMEGPDSFASSWKSITRSSSTPNSTCMGICRNCSGRPRAVSSSCERWTATPSTIATTGSSSAAGCCARTGAQSARRPTAAARTGLASMAQLQGSVPKPAP